MRHARVVLVVVDVCLMAYWAATAMHLIPLDKAFKDYEDATIQAWNWSFLPLDSLAATLGDAPRRQEAAVREGDPDNRADSHFLRGTHGRVLLGALRGHQPRVVGAEYHADDRSVRCVRDTPP